MDFISEYFYVIILIVGAIAQWLKSRSGSEQEEESRSEEPDWYTEELEDFSGRSGARQLASRSSSAAASGWCFAGRRAITGSQFT